MGAGLVAARDEGAPLSLIALSAATMSFVPLMPAGSLFGPIRTKSLYITGIALHAEAFGQEFFLRRLGVHEHHVGIAAPAGVERLTGALRDHLHVDAGLGLEQRQDVAEQAGILRRGGRRHDDRFVLRERRGREYEAGGHRNQQTARKHVHVSSPISFLSRSNGTFRSDRTDRRENRRPLRFAGGRRSDAAAPVSTTRPRCSRTISPASRRASPRSWVAITTLMPRAARRG